MLRILRMVFLNLFRIPAAWFKLCRYAKHPEKYSEKERFDHVRYILSLAVNKGNVKLEVSGQEHIPEESGYMLYANHQGMFDVMAIAATCRNPIGAVLKKELYNIPFIHQVCKCTKSFPMDREDVRQSLTVIGNVTEEVKAGRNYLIFPEGTRSRKGNEMLPFHHGSFRCATKSKCPVIPVALTDSFLVLDGKGCAPVTVGVQYLEPIYYEEYAGMKPAELAQLVQQRIGEAIERKLRN